MSPKNKSKIVPLRFKPDNERKPPLSWEYHHDWVYCPTMDKYVWRRVYRDFDIDKDRLDGFSTDNSPDWSTVQYYYYGWFSEDGRRKSHRLNKSYHYREYKF